MRKTDCPYAEECIHHHTHLCHHCRHNKTRKKDYYSPDPSCPCPHCYHRCPHRYHPWYYPWYYPWHTSWTNPNYGTSTITLDAQTTATSTGNWWLLPTED